MPLQHYISNQQVTPIQRVNYRYLHKGIHILLIFHFFTTQPNPLPNIIIWPSIFLINFYNDARGKDARDKRYHEYEIPKAYF